MTAPRIPGFPKRPRITLGPVESVGYYASPELARQVDPIQAGLRLGQQSTNTDAQRRAQLGLATQGTSFPATVGDIAANNLVDVFLPGDYSQFDQQAIDRLKTPMTTDRATLLGLAGAGGSLGGNALLGTATPNVAIERGMALPVIAKQLVKGGLVDAFVGGGLGTADAMAQGQSFPEALKGAIRPALEQAVVGTGLRGLHHAPAIGDAVRETGRNLWDATETFLTGGPTGATPHQEYQTYVDAGQIPPRRLRQLMDEHDARVNAEEAAMGVSRPEPRGELSFLPDLANERGAVGTSPDEYAGSHRAAGADGAPGHDLTGGGEFYPDDVYSPSGARIYGHGEGAMDQRTMNILHRLRGNPNATVTIYRAVPDEFLPSKRVERLEANKRYILRHGRLPPEVETHLSRSEYYDAISEEIERLRSQSDESVDINPGDWVTPNRAYAKMHGESALHGEYTILSKKVRADEIRTDANSIHEWGYAPRPRHPSAGHGSNRMMALAGAAAGGGLTAAMLAQRDSTRSRK